MRSCRCAIAHYPDRLPNQRAGPFQRDFRTNEQRLATIGRHVRAAGDDIDRRRCDLDQIAQVVDDTGRRYRRSFRRSARRDAFAVLGPEPVEDGADRPRFDLQKGHRQMVDEVAISVLARPERPQRAIIDHGAVDRQKDDIGVCPTLGSPDRHDRVAEG